MSSELINKVRTRIEVLSVAEAQPLMIKYVRIAVRRNVYKYAKSHAIIDFEDNQLVEQVHRDYRQNMIDIALNKVSEINNATTIEEILDVYDQISQWLFIKF